MLKEIDHQIQRSFEKSFESDLALNTSINYENKEEEIICPTDCTNQADCSTTNKIDWIDMDDDMQMPIKRSLENQKWYKEFMRSLEAGKC